MKDFYDLWYLSRAFSFEGATLCAAFEATFTRRGEPFPEGGLPLALTEEFAQNTEKARQWASFVGKTALAMDDRNLSQLIAAIRAFLQPPLAALAKGEAFESVWSPDNGWIILSGEQS